MSEVVQPVDPRMLAKKALLAGAARGLKLLERMPALFAKRGWKAEGDAVTIAIAALCVYSLGGLGQPINVPLSLWDRPEWRFAGETMGRVSAAEVIAHLDLKELLRVD